MLQLSRLFCSRAGDAANAIFGSDYLTASRLPFNASQACIGFPASTSVHWPTGTLSTHPIPTTAFPLVIPMNLPTYPRASPSAHRHGPLLASYGRPPAGGASKPTTSSSAIPIEMHLNRSSPDNGRWTWIGVATPRLRGVTTEALACSTTLAPRIAAEITLRLGPGGACLQLTLWMRYTSPTNERALLCTAETPLRGDALRLDPEECRVRTPEGHALEFTEANMHM